ncbi:MAG: S-adenosylmethionine:tRNA ribosyltransferase-isomerase, partial [Planctomycetota bacterium]|nr:S-adenosylmethionine:tRNA ribosyltransferase-isomerase [Planctomycetota bacterium]
MIAQRPCEPRDACRLMVVDRATGELRHGDFRDLPALLQTNDCLVRNKTSVLPARFSARRRTGGLIGGLFVSEEQPGKWTVLLDGAGRLRPGEILSLGDAAWTLALTERRQRGAWRVSVAPADPAAAILERIGRAPLPPYIRRSKSPEPEIDRRDLENYQTVYASVPGAIAAPTAGMHFTPATLRQIDARGVQSADVVLHVGVGTFAPVEVEDLADHPMHREW